MGKILVGVIFVWSLAGLPGITHAFPYYSPNSPIWGQSLEALPGGFITLVMGNEVYYYSMGIFYQKVILVNKYIAVPPPLGWVVGDIPRTCRLMLVDGITYYEYAGVYYVRVLEGYRVIDPSLLLI